jgi:ATP-dependent Clp protease protease subunit
VPLTRSKTPFLDRLQAWSKEQKLEPKVLAKPEGDALKLSIYGPIGDFYFESITDKQVARALDESDPSEIELTINSPGGDAFMGVAIYNLLKAHRAKVTVNVVGEAASAAGIISQAGDRIVMGQGAMLMIHNAWTITLGSWKDHRSAMNLLKKMDQSQAEILTSRSNLSKDRVLTLMDRETWFTADEAISFGLADERADGSPHVEDQDLDEDPEALIKALSRHTGPSSQGPTQVPKKPNSLDREGLRPIGSLFSFVKP